MMPPRTVLLIRSSAIGWDELRRALRGMDSVRLVGDTRHPDEGFQLAQSLSPDAIIAAPVVDGTATRPPLVHLKHHTLPNLKIIFFATRIDPAELAAVDEVSIAAYLLTGDLSIDVLRHAVAAVLIGDLIVASRDVVQAFIRVNGPRPPLVPGAPVLTDREMAILRLLANGQSRQEITASAVSYTHLTLPTKRIV